VQELLDNRFNVLFGITVIGLLKFPADFAQRIAT